MNKIFKNPYLQQFLFWSISFLILHRLFTREGDNGLIDIYFTILFHLPLVLVVYGNFYLVQEFIIKKSKISYYLIGGIFLLGIGTGFHYLTYNYLADWLFEGYYFVTFYTVREVLEFVASYAIISTLLFLSRNWFLLKERQLALEKENHQIKLASLKNQINPHFLFNSLNNIYGITSAENKLGRNYLLQLSDALRYMIYDTSEDFVPLEKEINYIENYVALEKLRIENNELIDLKMEGYFSGYMIAPLILLPIIENCFKYVNREDPFIDILLSIENEQLSILAKNNITQNEIPKKGGIGLRNLKNRLHLIYPDKHQLTIKDEINSYQIRLEIGLQ